MEKYSFSDLSAFFISFSFLLFVGTRALDKKISGARFVIEHQQLFVKKVRDKNSFIAKLFVGGNWDVASLGDHQIRIDWYG